MRARTDGGGAAGEHAADSVRLAGLEGFWDKDRRGGGGGQGAGAGGEAAMAATRVLAKGECIGGGYLDATAAAMEAHPAAATTILAAAVAAPIVDVTLTARPRTPPDALPLPPPAATSRPFVSVTI
jgi:hypothetical protein